MRPRFIAVPTLVGAIVVASALLFTQGGGTSSSTRPAATSANRTGNGISIKNFMFGPNVLTVKAGTTVTVTNLDGAEHTATAMPGFDSGTLTQGRSASLNLTKPGTYNYICLFHAFMKGTIKVTA